LKRRRKNNAQPQTKGRGGDYFKITRRRPNARIGRGKTWAGNNRIRRGGKQGGKKKKGVPLGPKNARATFRKRRAGENASMKSTKKNEKRKGGASGGQKLQVRGKCWLARGGGRKTVLVFHGAWQHIGQQNKGVSTGNRERKGIEERGKLGRYDKEGLIPLKGRWPEKTSKESSFQASQNEEEGSKTKSEGKAQKKNK